MKCQKCGYEPSLKEIQVGGECPGCLDDERRYQQRIQEIAAAPSRPRPQEVVVVDLNMSFSSMVWFMVKWVLASIPAMIILAILFLVATSVIGLIGVSGPPPKL